MTNLYTWLAALPSRPDLPAWLQAFAAIVALFISAWASWRVGASERRRDRLQARAITVAIYPEIQKLGITCKNTRHHLLDIKKEADRLAGQSVGASIQFCQIQVPPLLTVTSTNYTCLASQQGLLVCNS
jgi:hypothetical protein